MVAPYKDHRLLLLKLDKQMGGTIYCFFTSNEAQGLEGVEYHIGGGGAGCSTYASLDAKFNQ